MLPRFFCAGLEYLLLEHTPYHHAPEHRPTDEDAVADEVNDGVADVDELFEVAHRVSADDLENFRMDSIPI